MIDYRNIDNILSTELKEGIFINRTALDICGDMQYDVMFKAQKSFKISKRVMRQVNNLDEHIYKMIQYSEISIAKLIRELVFGFVQTNHPLKVFDINLKTSESCPTRGVYSTPNGFSFHYRYIYI